MQPLPGHQQAPTEPFVFAHGPPHDNCINRTEFPAKFRRVEATIVTHPSTEDGTHPGRYLFQLQVAAQMQTPAADPLSHSFGGLLTNRRKKAHKPSPLTASRRPWPKRIAQKVEGTLGVGSATFRILAVYDLGLL